MPAAPLITPAPVPRDLPAATKLVVRQQVTTISVVASSAPSGVNTGPDTSEKKGFPIAVAIPALVGGMAAAIAAFGLWWWCHKKSKKERRERWEAAQRKKQRARANSAGRPSMSTSRSPSATNLKNMGEKDVIPPVPALPKHYPPTAEKQQQQYGYGYQQQPDPYGQMQYQQQQQYGGEQQQQQYHTQPTIDNGPISPTYSDHSTGSGPSSSGSGSSSAPLVKEPKKTSPTKSGSRSTARVAVADSAAASAGLDPAVRYQPKKPSPLALKAMEKQKAENEWGQGPFRSNSTGAGTGADGDQETLNDGQANDQSQPRQPGRNVMSGEWGVALGSPNHDTSASFADQQSSASAAAAGNRFSNDPYLSANPNNRAPSGQYSNDPYAGYHDPVANAAGKKNTWV